MRICVSTSLGRLLKGDSVKIIEDQMLPEFKGKIDLILTSPPFPLNPVIANNGPMWH